MSTPFSERDDDQPPDGRSDGEPQKYAPKRPRLPRADPDKELGKLNADPPWLRKDRPGAFVGDLDSGELRNRPGLVDRVPEPPLPASSGSLLTTARLVTLLVGAAVGVAAGAIGYRWSMVPPT